jgi:predicted RNase H-like HicB family nuclease
VCLILEPGATGGYRVTSPDLPGLVTEGRTPDEILRNVQAALEPLKAAWEQIGVDTPPALRGNLVDRPNAVDMLVLA